MGMLAGIGSLVGGGMGLAGNMGLFGNGSNTAPPPPPMPNVPSQFLDLGGITSGIGSGISGLGAYNLGGQNLGMYSNILQGTVNNPYRGDAIAYADQFGQAGRANAQQGGQNASMISGAIPQVMGDANSMRGLAGNLINTAFDPQSALYNRTAQQVGDQQNVNLANSGLAQTPWGQGVYGNTMGNFNIDWQNNQLQRQMQGAQGAGNLYTGAAGLDQTALGLGQGAFGLGNEAATAGGAAGFMPYNAYNTVGSNQLNTLAGGSAYGQSASAIPQTGIGDWLQYLSGANQANQVALRSAEAPLDWYNAQLQGGQQQFNQNQTFGQGIGSGLQALSGFGGFGGLGSFNAGTGGSYPMGPGYDPSTGFFAGPH